MQNLKRCSLSFVQVLMGEEKDEGWDAPLGIKINQFSLYRFPYFGFVTQFVAFP